MPFSPIKMPAKSNLFPGLLAPQGWAFFTRNPREEQLYVYERENESWKLKTLPNSYFFLGAGRDMRTQSSEVNDLLANVYNKKWVEFNSPINFYEIEKMTPIHIKNKLLHPTICGDVFIKAVAPKPWAWSKNEKFIMPYKIVRLNVTCGN